MKRMTLNAAEREVCRVLGTDPAKFLAHKAKIAARAVEARRAATRDAPRMTTTPKRTATTTLTAADVRVARVLGVDLQQLAEYKARGR